MYMISSLRHSRVDDAEHDVTRSYYVHQAVAVLGTAALMMRSMMLAKVRPTRWQSRTLVDAW